MTQRSRVRVPPGPLSSNNFGQIICTRVAQDNSAFHPSGVVNESQIILMILAANDSESLPENIAGEGHRAASWGIGGSVC